MLLEASLKTRKPRSPANIGFSSRIFFPAGAGVLWLFRDIRVSQANRRSPPRFYFLSSASSVRELDEDEPAIASVGRILGHHGMTCGTGTSEEVEDNVVPSIAETFQHPSE